MELAQPIRILSDIHLNHPATIAAGPEELLPLLRDVRTVIFNGDTVELRFAASRAEGQQIMDRLRQLCAEAKVEAIFLNGNHDPIVSSLNHLDLADGAIVLTHGDILFYDISPWSAEAPALEEAHARALEEMGEDAFSDFERRLHANKKASLAFELHEPTTPRGRMARLRTYLHEGWPPWRPLSILKVWWQTPTLAVALARVFRPRARFILVGHTHRAGIWRIGPRIVMNTGGFIPAGGSMLVDLADDHLTARKIVRTTEGFAPGKCIGRFAVSKLGVQEGF